MAFLDRQYSKHSRHAIECNNRWPDWSPYRRWDAQFAGGNNRLDTQYTEKLLALILVEHEKPYEISCKRLDTLPKAGEGARQSVIPHGMNMTYCTIGDLNGYSLTY